MFKIAPAPELPLIPIQFAPTANWLWVQSSSQRMFLVSASGQILNAWIIATAKAGMGELENSACTPRGWHKIGAAFGANSNNLAVFVGRKPTGEIWSQNLEQKQPHRDWILGRILWLFGLEKGQNLGGKQDTRQRFIYIHGVPPTRVLGRPASQGCINVHPSSLQEVFAAAPVGTRVLIS